MTKNVIKRVSMGLALGLLGLAPGCDSKVVEATPCVSENGRICEPAGFPFVTDVGTRSDACPGIVGADCDKPASKTTNELTLPEPGKVCMKGTVAGREGFAWTLFAFNHWAQGFGIVDAFDAKALGITELRFDIQTPPPAGMTMFATTVRNFICTTPPDCLSGFSLTTGPRSSTVRVIDETGPVSAPFTNFVKTDDVNVRFDTSKLAHFIFVLGAGDYDFCISNLKFVDASGNEIVPATTDGGASDGETEVGE